MIIKGNSHVVFASDRRASGAAAAANDGARRAAEAAEGRPRTPILALTANAMAHQVAEYLAVGFDGHVAKPIDAGRLYQALADAVSVADDAAEAAPARRATASARGA